MQQKESPYFEEALCQSRSNNGLDSCNVYGEREHISPFAQQQYKAKASAADRDNASQTSLFRNEVREAFGSHQGACIPLRHLPNTSATTKVSVGDIEPGNKLESGTTAEQKTIDGRAYRPIKM
jgi:hypothetical protein